MSYRTHFISILAETIIAGDWEVSCMVTQASLMTGKKWRWLRGLCIRIVDAFDNEVRPRKAVLIQFIQHDKGFQKAWLKWQGELAIVNYPLASPSMSKPLNSLGDLDAPDLPTTKNLANWLELINSEFDWFSNLWGQGRFVVEGLLRHYVYRRIHKSHKPVRLLEIPKSRLRGLQRKILHNILDRVPLHPSTHGFRKNCSCITYVRPHVNKTLVIRFDLKNFFNSIPSGRVNAIFRAIGYPENVARYLTGLCTNQVPLDALNGLSNTGDALLCWHDRKRLQDRHLPQGAPTSPVLANLCAYRLDLRLVALVKSLGAQYTRYADDLAFSQTSPF